MIEYTLRQLEVFTAATEQESLTRAADQLHLTQSTASTPVSYTHLDVYKRQGWYLG